MIFTATPAFWTQLQALPVAQRLATAPAELVDHIAACNAATDQPARPAAVEPDEAALLDVFHAIDGLPASVLSRLDDCLLGIFFVSGLGSSAVTDVIALADGGLLGAVIAVDLEAFAGRTANQWACWKEETPFLADDDIAVEAIIAKRGDDHHRVALQYVLLHEFAHAVAAGMDFVPDNWLTPLQIQPDDAYQYLPLSWSITADHRVVPLAAEEFAQRDELVYYQQPRLPASALPGMLRALSQTSFPTLYAATCVHDDFAESFAGYVHAVLLGRPYRVRVYQRGEVAAEVDRFWDTPRAATKRAFFAAYLAGERTGGVRAPRVRARRDSSEQNADIVRRGSTAYLGLAPFLRASINGVDLRPIAEALLALANEQMEQPELWLNLATAFFSLGLREPGRAIQEQALQMQREYLLAPALPARRTLLVLVAAGDIAENIPIDCLLENGDIALHYYFADARSPLPASLPAHDAVLVAISDSAANRPLLEALDTLLRDWPHPVINTPRHVPHTERSRASDLMHAVPGILMPPTRAVTRSHLLALAAGQAQLADVYPGCALPLIVRPVGSQAGRDLARLGSLADVETYLAAVADAEFFVSSFIDYRSDDQLFRKYRIAFIDGNAFACHMGISANWMIHYVNAGMYEDAAKRAEEAAFMTHFDEFRRRHAAAFAILCERIGLDYFCIDCAQTRDGRLLIFEIDHVMVIHAMDPPDLFPYKQTHMHQVKTAFARYLDRRIAHADAIGRECNR